MPPVYTAGGGSGKVRKNRVRMHVGPGSVGFWNLKRNQRNSRGQFVRTDGATPQFPEAWRWPSLRSYHRQALSGQISQLTDQIQRWSQHVTVNADRVLYDALLPTFHKSQVYAPKDTQLLVNSGRLDVEPAKTAGGSRRSATASISYGGRGVPFYAVYVHEILSYRHDPPTRAKFLESALREDMDKIRDRMVNGLRKVTGGGI